MLKSDEPRIPSAPTALQRYGAVAVGALSISSASILIRLTAAPAVAIAFWRLVLSTLVLAPVVLMKPKRWLSWAHLKGFTLSGLFLALHFIFWIQSLMVLPVALSTALVSTHPILLAFYGRYFQKRPFSRSIKGGLVCTALGLGILPLHTAWSLHQTAGMLEALLGSVFAGLYLLSGQHYRQSLSATQYSFGTYFMSSLILLAIHFAHSEPLGPLNPRLIVLYCLMAVIPTMGGHTTFNWLLRFMPARQVSMAMIGEIPGSALLAWIVLHQIPAWPVWISLFFITAGIAATLYSAGEASPGALASQS
ncbi:MAG: DMT family transporter [Firmicutes bacterium]|nr:DMT family transporter [Bacillota bacterium]